MVSIKKLYKEGKMYLNQEELQAIQRGQLKEYLHQFQIIEMGEQINVNNLHFKNLGQKARNFEDQEDSKE